MCENATSQSGSLSTVRQLSTKGTNTKWSETVYDYKKGSNFQVDMSFKASTYDGYMIMYVIPLEKSVAHLTQRFQF